jgi:hypothetical protein
MQPFTNPLTACIADFLDSIGVEVAKADLPEPTFLPGIKVEQGRLIVDEGRLLYPGDLLHEAGHIAVMTPADRAERRGDIGVAQGEEIAAIAWSYAATVHLGIDPAVVFHPNGYRGDSKLFLDSFEQGRFIGVPLLQWMGLTLTEKNSEQENIPVYPEMIRWLRA